MSGVGLIARFDGDPADLAQRFRRAAQRYASVPPTIPQPTTAILLHDGSGISVVLVWAEGASLQPFRTFLRAALEEFGLPHPQVTHLRADATSWADISRGHPPVPV